MARDNFHYSSSLSGDLFKFSGEMLDGGGVFMAGALRAEVSVHNQNVTDSQG